MWLLIPAAAAGLFGWHRFKAKGGAKSLGKEAGIAAAKGLRDEAERQASRAYRAALELGHHPKHAAQAAEKVAHDFLRKVTGA